MISTGPDFYELVAEYQVKQRRRRRWYKIFSALACVMVFCTTYALILPAITMETPRVLDCQLSVHTHTEDCYDGEGNLVCGQAGFVVHTHNEDCYDEEGNLVCPLPEIEAHTHTSECYTEQEVLICGREESEGHRHDESCYTVELGGLICENTDPEHVHTDACYEQIPVLACGLEEGEGAHTHTGDCYGVEKVLTCGREEAVLHTHTDECYDGDGNLICGQLEVLEHVHTDECFVLAEDSGIMLLANETEEQGNSFTLTYTDNGIDYTITFSVVDTNGKAIPGDYSSDDIIAETATRYVFGAAADDSLAENTGEKISVVEKIAPVIDGYTYSGAVYSGHTVYSVGTYDYNNTIGGSVLGARFYSTEPLTTGQYYSGNASTTNYTVTLTYTKDLVLDGSSFVIINQSGTTNYALTTTSATVNGVDGLASETVALTASGRVITSGVTEWEFTKVPDTDDQYYISTTVGGVKKYLTLGATPYDSSNVDGRGSLTLSDTPQAITAAVSGNAVILHAGDNNSTVNLDGAVQDFWCFNDWTSPDASSQLLLAEAIHTVPGVTPTGTVINMFDYWAIYNGLTYDEDGNLLGGDYSYEYTNGNLNSGINADHFLKFTRNQDSQGSGSANAWTGTVEPQQGIVQSILQKGVPVLTAGRTSDKAGTSTAESLAYLFDPDYTGESAEYRTAYTNVGGLLQVDSQGYYYYDSQKNFAELDTEKNQFTLYEQGGVQPGGSDKTLKGQFFPFDKLEDVNDKSSASDYVNHYFGMTMTTRFVHRNDGYTTADKNTAVEFEFAGDDDVWIFVDDVLVADLGGIHDRASVKINFATGEIIINENSTDYKTTTSLYAMFEAAGKANSVKWLDDAHTTFANGTYHTLRFFFLERGNTDSNLHLKYNLASYPPSGVTKVNQYGDPVPGAVFKVYKSNASWAYTVEDGDETNDLVYTGKTDAEGKLTFVDKDNMPYTMDELEDMFGEYFVLKETEVPSGYRLVSDEIHLHISNDVLLCENTWDSGVWADTNLLVSAHNTVKLTNGETVDAAENGKIFAVVLKYTGARDTNGLASEDDLTKEANWAPLYGTAATGFTIIDAEKRKEDYGNNFIAAAIFAAKQYVESQNEFALGSSGALEGTVNGMPGNVGKYYYMLPEGQKGQTEYTVAYYWTSANSMKEADENNTYRIDADDETYSFDRVFGATINVPNLVNDLYAQKFDNEGNRVNGAAFALYEVAEDENNPGTIYYLDTSGNKVSLIGATYTSDPATGIITGTKDGTAFAIKPYMVEKTMPANDENNKTAEDGTAVFSYVKAGNYYLREIAAPRGYELNLTEVMVRITDNAVYANAGDTDDGITVARGPGYIVKPLDQFASYGDVNNTLTWVCERMKITGVSNTFTAFNTTGFGWAYLKTNKSGDTVSEGEDPYTVHLMYANDETNKLFNFTVNTEWYENQGYTSDQIKDLTRRLYTTVGWSYYELYQDYSDNHVKQAENKRAAYEDLSGKEIANLFSRAVFVQFTDQPSIGSLEISKTVTPDATTTQFRFDLSLTDPDDKTKALEGTYTYKLYDVTYDENGKEVSRTAVQKTDENGVGVTDAEGNPVYATGTITSGEAKLTLTNNQVVVIENLPANTGYTVTETSGSDSSGTFGYTPQVSTNGAAAVERAETSGTLVWRADRRADPGENVCTVAYTNALLPLIKLQKVDSKTGEALAGASFVLYYEDENGVKYYNGKEFSPLDGKTEADYARTTPESGELLFAGLIPDKTYCLEEVAAPDGYNSLTQAITIEVDADGKISVKDGNKAEYTADVSKHEGRELDLTVKNQPGFVLPETGGMGTFPYTIGGALLMACSLLCGHLLRRKEERRSAR